MKKSNQKVKKVPQKSRKKDESDNSQGSQDDYCQTGFTDNFYCVDKILKQRKLKNGKQQVFVSWKGWGSQENSWVYKSSLMEYQTFLELDNTTVQTQPQEIVNAGKQKQKILVQHQTQSDYDSYEPMKRKKRKGKEPKTKYMSIIKQQKTKIEKFDKSDAKQQETSLQTGLSFQSSASPSIKGNSTATGESLLLDGQAEAAFQNYFFSKNMRETDLWINMRKKYPDLFTSFKKEISNE